MARVSDKALRPRQYVFNRLSAERITALAPGVRKLRDYERRQMVQARATRRIAEQRHMAARHAERLMKGVKESGAETEEIGELEKELEELRSRKRQLFEQLRQSLDDDEQTGRHVKTEHQQEQEQQQHAQQRQRQDMEKKE